MGKVLGDFNGAVASALATTQQMIFAAHERQTIDLRNEATDCTYPYPHRVCGHSIHTHARAQRTNTLTHSRAHAHTHTGAQSWQQPLVPLVFHWQQPSAEYDPLTYPHARACTQTKASTRTARMSTRMRIYTTLRTTRTAHTHATTHAHACG